MVIDQTLERPKEKFKNVQLQWIRIDHRCGRASAGSAHQKIFQLVNELAVGSSFILVNDHDPMPLYYQLEAEYPELFCWTYFRQRPGGVARRDRKARRGGFA